MRPTMMLRSCAFAVTMLAALGGAGVVNAEPPQAPDEQSTPVPQPSDDALEQFGEEPIDLSTPLPPPDGKAGLASLSAKPHVGRDWDAKVGVDHHKPSFPAAELLPEQLLAGAAQDQSTGVAWAKVTAPGLRAPLGWDTTSLETRLDAGQEEGMLGTTLSRSIPVGAGLSMTLQNGYSLTRTLPHALTSSGTAAAHSWATSQSLKFDLAPTDTTVSLGAALSSTEDKWLRSLSAEQKLFGGPVSLTGTLSETTTGDTSKSLKAGFKRTW